MSKSRSSRAQRFAVSEAFGSPAESDKGPSRLIKTLEEILEADRIDWPASVLRALWEPLKEAIDLRRKSPRHESRWLNLAGYCLRPGTGYPLDDHRIKALWTLFHQGVFHTKDTQCWCDWWILWRRTAAGLTRAHHEEIHRRVLGLLPLGKTSTKKKLDRPKPEQHELAELWRLEASLERLNTQAKQILGDALITQLAQKTVPLHALWSIGRLGARVPLFGPANVVVAPELAATWIDRLLERGYETKRERTDAIFALVQLAQRLGRSSSRHSRIDEEPRHRETDLARRPRGFDSGRPRVSRLGILEAERGARRRLAHGT